MVESGSTSQRHPSTPDASTPNGIRTPVHLERVTVTDLLQELEACQPDAESASPSSPPGRPRMPSIPGTAAVQVDLDRTSVVELGQGAQLPPLTRP
jgi:hypothetical protein